MKKLIAFLFLMASPALADHGATWYDLSGVNYLQITAPASLSGNYRVIMPTTTGTTNQVLGIYSISGATMTLSWLTPSGGSGTAWGSITGTLSNQVDLQTNFNAVGVSTAVLQAQINAGGAGGGGVIHGSANTLSFYAVDGSTVSSLPILITNGAVFTSSNSLPSSLGPLPYWYEAHTNSLQSTDISYSATIPIAAISGSTIPNQVAVTGPSTGTAVPSSLMSNAREYHACTPTPFVSEDAQVCCGGNAVDIAGFYNTCDLLKNGVTAAIATMGNAKDTLLLARLPNNYLVQAFGANNISELSDSQILIDTGTPDQWFWQPIGDVNVQCGQSAWTYTVSGYPIMIAGVANNGTALGRSEYLSPSYVWTLGFTLLTPRFNHGAWLMDDGTHMVCGGHTQTLTATNSCERCSLATMQCVPDASLPAARELFGYGKTKEGNLYIDGGYDNSGTPQSTRFIYITQEKRWVPGPQMTVPRVSGQNFSATDVNGKVWDISGQTTGGNYTNTTDIFDPYLWTNTAGPSLLWAAHDFFLTSLPDGNLVPTGGSNATIDFSSVTILNMRSSQWTSSPNLYSISTSSNAVFGGTTFYQNGSYAATGSGVPSNSKALCLLAGVSGHCTTVIDSSGGCTCVSP